MSNNSNYCNMSKYSYINYYINKSSNSNNSNYSINKSNNFSNKII